MKAQTKEKLFTAWCMILIFILVFHFCMTLIYNAPDNPITYYYDGMIQTYMAPIFIQNWRLFAPNPISTNNYLWVRGYSERSDGEESFTEWVNVSTPLVEEFHHNRFTPLRLALAQTTTAVVETLNKHSKDEDAYKQEIKAAIDGESDYPFEIVILKNTSSMVLHQKYNQHYDKIHMRIYINEFADYYDYITGDETAEESMLDLPLMPYAEVTGL